MRGAGDLAANGLQRLPPLQRRQDRVQNSFNIAVDIVIMKANDSVASIAQEPFSRTIPTTFVVGRMCRAVDLNHEFFPSANEVREIGPDGLLPNELEPAEKTVSKSPPKLTLGLGLVLAQLASSARFVQA